MLARVQTEIWKTWVRMVLVSSWMTSLLFLELYLAVWEMGICNLLLNQKKGCKHINVIESRMLGTV